MIPYQLMNITKTSNEYKEKNGLDIKLRSHGKSFGSISDCTLINLRNIANT